MMKAKDFNRRVNEMMSASNENGIKCENLCESLRKFGNVFQYAAWCEINMEANLREDYKRKTTFTSDLSIAEWCGGYTAVLDTIRRSLASYKDSIEYFAEFVIAVNLKSWEMHARGFAHWSAFYADLYYLVRDLYLDHFSGNDEAIQYYFDYVD